MADHDRNEGRFVKEVRGFQCSEDSIKVDIIVVSAICADPVKTWRAGSSKLTWLEEDLLRHLPMARVLFYDSVVTPNDDLSDLAERLLKTLERRYSDDIMSDERFECPLIFLCHSTGGLIVKQALALVWEQKWMYLALLKSIIGVAFFAVPHWGSENLSDQEFVRTARKMIDITWEYDIPRTRKIRQNKLIYTNPLPKKMAASLATSSDGLVRLVGLFDPVMSYQDSDQAGISVWSVHETIPTVWRRLPSKPDDNHAERPLLLPQPNAAKGEFAITGTNISVPCDHYGTASFDTMHSIEERGPGALQQESRPSFKLNFILQLQARVSEYFWTSEDITLNLKVENFHFYKDGLDTVYVSQSSPLAELLEGEEAAYHALLNVAIRREMQPATQKYRPVPTRFAKTPISVLKSSKIEKTKEITGSMPGTPARSIDGGRAANPSKSVRILVFNKAVNLPDHDFHDSRTSRDDISRHEGSPRASNQEHLRMGRPGLSDSTSPDGVVGTSQVSFQDEDPAAAEVKYSSAAKFQCQWVHVPCNHIYWTEKIVSGIGAATNNDDRCEEMLEEKYWEKKINFATHDFPHARYIHSTCEFLGLEVNESSVPPELSSLLNAHGAEIVEKLFGHFENNRKPGKHHTASLREASSSARQLLFMPYLHWEPFEKFQQREAIIHNRMRLESQFKEGHEPNQVESRAFGRESLAAQTRIEGQLLLDVPLFTRLKSYFDNSPELRLIWQYLGADTLLHCRRTLDQYMFSTLPDTAARDRDQILYKSHISNSIYKSMEDEDSSEASINLDVYAQKRNILVVEQLWMFVLDNDTLITFFPPKEVKDELSETMFSSATELDIPSYLSRTLRTNGDLRACIVADLEEEMEFIESQWDLAALVVKHVVTVFCSDTGPRVFSTFGTYVERLTERQAQSWSKLRLRRGLNLGGSSKEIQQIFQDLRDLRELRDVEDELRIIKKVLDKQKLHIETMKKTYKESLGRVETRGFKYLEEALYVLDSNLDRIRRMLNNVELTSKGYEELLTLQQNQISINEAVAAGEQSRAVTIFTVFTVLFLPLSFFTSVFGMNVSDWSGTPTNVSIKLVLSVMLPVSFVVIALTFLFAMNSNFREIFGSVLDFSLEIILLIYETFTQFPTIAKAWNWISLKIVVPLVLKMKARKRARLDRTTRADLKASSVPNRARKSSIGSVMKMEGSVASAEVVGGLKKRVRWRTLFVGRKSQNGAPEEPAISGVQNLDV